MVDFIYLRDKISIQIGLRDRTVTPICGRLLILKHSFGRRDAHNSIMFGTYNPEERV